MNTGVTKTDFIYFQNDILKDIKNLEKTFTDKIESIIKEVNKTKTYADSNFTKYSLLISDVAEKVGVSEGNSKINEELNIIKKKLEDVSINSRIKTNSLEKEFNNMSMKYDKIFINNLVVPGLIGNSCTFPTLASFIDNINKKISELTIDKKKKDIDLKSYKEKLDSLINTFNNRVNNSEEKFKQYCNICFENFDKNSNDRFNLLEERIGTLRMENGKYSAELIERSNELKADWDKIMGIKTEIYDKLNSELEKYVKYNSDLLKVFESQKSEFTLLKNRFTELSEFIKDVRFRNNLTTKENNTYNSPNMNTTRNRNINNNAFTQLTNYQKRVKFTQMSKRINFKLKQNLDDSFKDIKSKKHLTNINKNYQDKKDNSIHHSPAKTEYRFGDNDSNSSETFKDDNEEKNEEIFLDNKDKDLENNKINEEEKDNPINKEYLINNKPLDLDKERSKLKLKTSNLMNKSNTIDKKKHKTNIHSRPNLLSTKKIHIENKQNKSTINKDSENEFSGDDGIKSIINKKNEIKTSKNLKSNVGILKHEITKTTSIKKLKLNLKDSPKSRNDSPKEKIKNRKIKFNKTIKVPEIKPKERENNKLKTHINKPNLKIKIEENKDENKNNIKNEKNQSKIKLFTPISKTNTPIKKESINSDNENKPNKIQENKFSFVTNIDIKEKEKEKETSKNENIIINNKIDDDIDINEENMNLNLNLNILNEKIIKINNRLNELYKNSDIKINKVYLYVKKVFDHFSGIFFFKEIYNQKFNFDLTSKSLMTDFSSIFPAHMNNKRKIILKGKNKFFTPTNLKKQFGYKTLVDQIEPFLIKKFKD